MPIRPGWYDGYWNKMDKETAKKVRTTCPKCGSAETYYNQQFRNWRCVKCENSFAVEGVGCKVPWWKRLFGRES